MTKLEVILGGVKTTTSNQLKENEIYRLEYDVNDVILSGFNFIRKYLGDYKEDIDERIVLSINHALNNTEDLLDLETQIYTNLDDATWMIGQEINNFYGPLNLGISKSVIDKIYQQLEPENQNPIYAVDIAIITYFQVFLNFLNEEENMEMLFKSKENVRRRAMIGNEQKMLKILNIMQKNPDYKITFLGNGFDKDAGIVEFYKYNEEMPKIVK